MMLSQKGRLFAHPLLRNTFLIFFLYFFTSQLNEIALLSFQQVHATSLLNTERCSNFITRIYRLRNTSVSLSLSISLPLSLSLFSFFYSSLSIYLSLSLDQPISLSIYLPIYLSVYVSFSLSLTDCMYVYTYVYASSHKSSAVSTGETWIHFDTTTLFYSVMDLANAGP